VPVKEVVDASKRKTSSHWENDKTAIYCSGSKKETVMGLLALEAKP